MPLSIPGSALGLGKVLQIVYGSTNASVQNNTATFIDTGLVATITPASTSSKIFIVVNQVELSKDTGNTGIALRLMRNSTALYQFSQAACFTNSTDRNDVGGVGTVYLDSPSTTSAVTYKTQFASQSNVSATYVQRGDISYSTIALLEIAP